MDMCAATVARRGEQGRLAVKRRPGRRPVYGVPAHPIAVRLVKQRTRTASRRVSEFAICESKPPSDRPAER